jgi:hypothetical protein
MEDPNRIKFALHLDNWDYETGNKKYLRKHAIEVTTTEYTPNMKGNIYCPECCVGLFRSPEEKEYDTNGRKAFYAHSRKYTPECSLRVKKAEGKRFDNEEQAKQAIENEELVIVKGFMKEKPLPPDINGPVEYQGDPIEDQDGGISSVPIGRHNGEEFKLPSKVTTVRGLCRNFEKNLHRYFFLPNQSNAQILQHLLINVETVTETCKEPKLYFGKIVGSWNCGKTPKNIRQTMLEYKRNNGYVDFCLKVTDEDSRDHGIDDDSIGKIVLMYGKVTVSGIGLSIERLGWGEFAVLPQKYAHLLYEST